MKQLTITLFLFILVSSSCKKDEPKSLIVTNGINQRLYSRYNTSTFTESVMILYVGSDGKYVRTDQFPISYASVQNLNNYQVTSTVLQDNIVSVYVLVNFYYTSNNVSIINYQSQEIAIHEGINTYTITQSDLTD